MKTEIRQAINSETEKYRWAMFLKPEEEDPNYESLVFVNAATDEELAILAARYKVSPEFLSEVATELTILRDAVDADLKDIWQRLDAMENSRSQAATTPK